jgi:hypothetical protein
MTHTLEDGQLNALDILGMPMPLRPHQLIEIKTEFKGSRV